MALGEVFGDELVVDQGSGSPVPRYRPGHDVGQHPGVGGAFTVADHGSRTPPSIVSAVDIEVADPWLEVSGGPTIRRVTRLTLIGLMSSAGRRRRYTVCRIEEGAQPAHHGGGGEHAAMTTRTNRRIVSAPAIYAAPPR